MPLNLVLIGPPGSGKGTQAVRLARRYRVPHISTGDILRQAVRDDTPLGRQVAATIASGALVGDELISSLVAERLTRRDTDQGFLLDGFPRTLNQAHLLDKLRDHLIVVHFAASDDEIVRLDPANDLDAIAIRVVHEKPLGPRNLRRVFDGDVSLLKMRSCRRDVL